MEVKDLNVRVGLLVTVGAMLSLDPVYAMNISFAGENYSPLPWLDPRVRIWSRRGLRKTGSDPGFVVVVSEERVGRMCWRDETTSMTVVSCEGSREREEASVVVRRRERERMTTERRENTGVKATVTGQVLFS